MWSQILTGVAVGVSVAAAGACLTHWSAGIRERKRRIEELRLDLYVEVHEFFRRLEYYHNTGNDREFIGSDDSAAENRMTHLVDLLGSEEVVAAYQDYRKTFFDALHAGSGHPAYPTSAHQVYDKRDKLKEEMRRDFADVLNRPKGLMDHVASIVSTSRSQQRLRITGQRN